MASARPGLRSVLSLFLVLHLPLAQAEEPARPPAGLLPDAVRPESVVPAARPPIPAAPAADSPAAAPWRGSPFAIRLAVDLPVTLGTGAIALISELAKSELPGPACGSCDPQQVNPLDRLSIGSHSRAARTASDVLVGINLGLPIALDLFDVLGNHPPDGWRGYGQDVLVLAEVFAVNASLNAIAKYAVRRPRPLVYDPDPGDFTAEERADPDAALSFYSSHSSISFSMATAYSYLFMRRHPGSKLIAPVWLLSEGLAATTAALRVAAGKHFITDVLTGAVVGGAIGLLIPYLHQRALPAGLPALASQYRFSVAPMASADGGGVVLTIE